MHKNKMSYVGHRMPLYGFTNIFIPCEHDFEGEGIWPV